MKPPLCATKKALKACLGFDSDHTINDMIRRGVIPGPLPGSRFFYLPAVFAALARHSPTRQTDKEAKP